MKRMLFLCLLLFANIASAGDTALALGANTEKIQWLAERYPRVVVAVETTQDKNRLKNSVQDNVEILVQPLAKTRLKDRRCKTFKQFLFDARLLDCSLSFIQCNLMGREEEILEDLLYYAYTHSIITSIAFEADAWKSTTPAKCRKLFSYFRTANGSGPIDTLLETCPKQDLVLWKKMGMGPLVKENIPVFIIAYNLPTFIKQTVEQVEKYTTDIIIMDNASFFPPLMDYYAHEYPYTLLSFQENHGHRVYQRSDVQALAGDLHVITDPDLLFHPDLPHDFLQEFVKISNQFGVQKVGFALYIEGDDIKEGAICNTYTIKGWEKQFWKDRLRYPQSTGMELYRACIDTTFTLVNLSKPRPYDIRVGGNCTCRHIPWHKGFEKDLMEGEWDAYRDRNRHPNSWFFMKDD